MHTACAGLQPITSSTRSSKYFVNGCCFCRKHVRICPGEGNGFLFESTFRKEGGQRGYCRIIERPLTGEGKKKRELH